MKFLSTIRPIIIATSLAGSTLTCGTAAATPNTSTYSMQLNGTVISVYETNSEDVNTAQADFTYSGSTGSFAVATPGVGSTFTFCPSQTSSSVVCTDLGGSASTGIAHLVATIALNPNVSAYGDSITVTMASSSRILATADHTDTLNHSNLPRVAYTIPTPAAATTPSTPPAQSTSSSTTSTASNSASAKTTATASKTTTSASTAASRPTTPQTTSTSDTTTGKSTQSDKQSVTKQDNAIKTSHAGLVTSSISALLVILAAAYWIFIRKRAEVAPVRAYKLNTAGKSQATVKKKLATSNKSIAKKKA